MDKKSELRNHALCRPFGIFIGNAMKLFRPDKKNHGFKSPDSNVTLVCPQILSAGGTTLPDCVGQTGIPPPNSWAGYEKLLPGNK